MKNNLNDEVLEEISIEKNDAEIIEKHKEKKEKNTKKRNYLISIGIAFFLVFMVSGLAIFNSTYYSFYLADTISMYPTLNKTIGDPAGNQVDGKKYSISSNCRVEWCLTNTHINNEALSRFSIVVIKNEDLNYSMLSRIIGLPGETIKINENGRLFVNSNEVNQSFIDSDNMKDTGEISITLTSGYYVLGDNRSIATDSRHYGEISPKYINSKLVKAMGTCFKGGAVPTGFSFGFPRYF